MSAQAENRAGGGPGRNRPASDGPVDILCIGSVLWDVIGRAETALPPGADRPGRIVRQPGGVAMNIARALAGFGLRPALLSAIGRDREGEALLSACARLGIVTAHVHRPADLPTDSYMAIEGPGGLAAAIADARSLEAAGAAILAPLEDGRLGSARAPYRGLVALDGNLTETLLADLTARPSLARADLRLAPASPGKARRLRAALGHPRLTLYVNREEAGLIAGCRPASAAEGARALLEMGLSRVLVTDGAHGAAEGWPRGLRQAPAPPVTVARVTGAGDMFMAAHIAAECAGAEPEAALVRALDAAAAHVAGRNTEKSR